jgi:hypothetical protein
MLQYAKVTGSGVLETNQTGFGGRSISFHFSTKNNIYDGIVTAKGRQELLKIAIEMTEKKGGCQIKQGVVEMLDSALHLFFTCMKNYRGRIKTLIKLWFA